MNPGFYAVLVALLVGAGGTGGGALIGCAIKASSKRICAALMGLSAGIVAAMVFFDMIPEALEIGGAASLVVGIAMGVAALALVIWLVPHKDATEFDDDVVSDIRTGRLKRTGMLIAVGIAIHNLPQGIAIGSGIVSGESFGITLSLLLLLHNIPEGVVMSLPLKFGGVPVPSILLLAVVAALPTVVGAIVGSLVANISPVFITGAMGFSAGAMGYLMLREMLPQAFSMYKGWSTVLCILLGAALGLLIVWLIG